MLSTQLTQIQTELQTTISSTRNFRTAAVALRDEQDDEEQPIDEIIDDIDYFLGVLEDELPALARMMKSLRAMGQ